MRRQSTWLPLAALGMIAAACGASDLADSSEPTPSDVADVAPTDIDSLPDTSLVEPEDRAPDGFDRVQSIDEIAGIWMPRAVGGEPVDAAALGAYLQISATEERVSVDGFDGCNGFGGTPTGVRPAFDDGRFAGLEFGSELIGCDVSIPVSPGSDALLFVSSDGAEFLADQNPFTESIRYARVDAIPIDPRQAMSEAEADDDEAARQGEEAEERAAFEAAEAEAREQIRTDLPDARTRWAESGISTYTLRFEVGALMVDPSFPQRRPVGGVWEIDVVDGVATENEWSNSIIGDTVDDWFAYVESQLDSHYLQVEFDPTLGAPTRIDSQPLDDRVLEDPNSVVAWLVVGEVVVPD